MNRRIRAEEMLRTSKMPGTLAIRDRSRLSTPAAHSDLPIDPSPIAPSPTSSVKRCLSPNKGKRRDKASKDEFITTSPQPFKFSTADRAAKKASGHILVCYIHTFIYEMQLELKTDFYLKIDLRPHYFIVFMVSFRWKKLQENFIKKARVQIVLV